MAEAEVKTKDEAKEAATDETVAASQEESTSTETTEEGVDATKTRLEEVKVKGGGSKPLFIKLAAVALFLAIAGGAVFFLKDGFVAEPVEVAEEVVQQDSDLDPSLSARELIQFGNQAHDSKNIKDASRFFEGARLRADLEAPNDINLTVDIYEGLAKIEEAKGNNKMAKIHRDYVRMKQAEVGESLALYNKAENLYRAGNQVEARKYFARFLLLAAELKNEGKRYVESANRRIADSRSVEFKTTYSSGKPVSLTNPEGFFNER